MKRFIFALLAFFAILCIVACQNKTSKSKNKANSNIISGHNEGIDTNHSFVENNPVPETPLKPETRENCDFRNAKWGDSKDDIKFYDPNMEITDEDDSTILSHGIVGGYNSHILYYFDENTGEFYQGVYYFDLNYSNAGQYIPVYDSLKDDLIEKYGTPIIDIILPLADENLIEVAGKSNALEFGYVQYGATWEKDSTDIFLTMAAQNYDVGLIIKYLDKNYSFTSDNGL